MIHFRRMVSIIFCQAILIKIIDDSEKYSFKASLEELAGIIALDQHITWYAVGPYQSLVSDERLFTTKQLHVQSTVLPQFL